MKELISQWVNAKHSLGEQLGASEALMHVHVGLIIFVLTALLMRRRMASTWPLAAVAMLAVLNEVVDYVGPSPSSLSQSAADFINTVLWPAVLFLLARRGAGIRTRL